MGRAKTVIGVTGTIGAGKDTVARHIGEKLGVPVFEVSKYIKDKVKETGLPMTRMNVMEMGTRIAEEEGLDVIARAYLEEIKDMAVISGFRQLPQLDYLKVNCKLILIAVEADPAIRFTRVCERRTVEEMPTLESFMAQEIEENNGNNPRRLFECMKRAKYCIKNDGDLETLFQKVDEVLEKEGFLV